MMTLVILFGAANGNAQNIPQFPPPYQISSIQTPCAPAVASLDGYLVMAYTSNDGNYKINLASSTDGANWSNFGTSGYSTTQNANSCSPAITPYNNSLFISWVTGGDNLIVEQAIPPNTPPNNSPNWEAIDETSINVGLGQGYLTNVAPGMIAYNGNIEIIYGASKNGSGLQNGYQLTYSPDGVHWTTTRSGLALSGISSGNAPSLAILNGMLYMTFQQNNSRHYLWYAQSTDGINWTAAANTDISYGGAPSMISWGNQLLIAFQQNNSNRNLFLAGTTNFESLNVAEDTNNQLGSAGSLVEFNGQILLYYKQNNSDNNLFYSSASAY